VAKEKNITYTLCCIVLNTVTCFDKKNPFAIVVALKTFLKQPTTTRNKIIWWPEREVELDYDQI